MDDINNNVGMGGTQNNSTVPTNNDYNSMQPISDLVDNLSGMPASAVDNRPVEEFPNQATSNPPVDMTTAASMPTMETPVIPTEMPTPTMETPVIPTEMPAPTMETPVSMPTEMSAPTMETPVIPTEMPAPTMETPVSMPTEMPMPTMETPETTPDEMPLPTQDLSQPLEQFSTPVETSMPAFQDSEVVNTLSEEKGEKGEKGKGGTAVVIVLIVVIVALLITIGYFAYKIFFA